MLSVFGGGGVFETGRSGGSDGPGAGLAEGAGVILIRFPSGGGDEAPGSCGLFVGCDRGGSVFCCEADWERERPAEASVDGVSGVPSVGADDDVFPSFASRLLRI